MNFKKAFILVVIIVIVIIGIFFSNSEHQKKDEMGKPNVVASFYPVYFFTNEIAKDKINLTNLVPAGVEPHEYELTARDLVLIEKSNLVILNGGGLEAWSENIYNNINKKTKIVSLGDGLATKTMEDEEGNPEQVTDPHIWLSPVIAIQMAEKIEESLSSIDPENSAYYKDNALVLKEKLIDLDNEYKQVLSTCLSRDIVTSHLAFAYLVSTYGLNQVSIVGLSTEEEPSAKQMAEVAQFAKSKGVKYIFFESLVSPKLSQTIAKEVGAETLVLNPIEGLTPNEIDSGEDYFSEMRKNLENLKIALSCK